MRDKFIKLKSVFKEFKERAEFVLNDTHGEFTFNVDVQEITAAFTEKRNEDLVPRLREILLGYPHIRHDTPSDGKIKEKNKEAV